MIKPDIFYYDEKNIYINRLDAIRSGNICKFYYYDDFFSTLDWTKEPSESLQELYRERAQQIRETYDHVVVCYSGGIDSTQVLESFYYNDIHIDEILVVGALSQDDQFGTDRNHNGDLYWNVFPYLKDLHLPNTKISFVDYTKYFNDINNFTLLQKYGVDYIEKIGIRTSVHNLLWYDLDKFLNHKKHTAYVMGKEKPTVKFDGRFSLAFHDISFTDYGNRYEYATGRRVNFYSDPEAYKIILKQSHKIKQHQQHLEEFPYPLPYSIYDNYTDRIKPIIYDIKRPLKHQSNKSKCTYLSARDMFMVDKKNSQIFDIYSKAMVNLSKIVDINSREVFESKKYYLS
jgi:hypothetical protein